jgi:AraC-like DNA-binding protein
MTPIDRLSTVLERFHVHAQLLHSGALCGVHRYGGGPGPGYLHVLRRGAMEVRHPKETGLPARVKLAQPTLLLYPRGTAHRFHNPPHEGADFTCATLHFDGGVRHPLARALPPLVVLPLARVDGLDAALALLFAETERVRCGHRLLADRLFDVVWVQLMRWLLDHPDEAGISPGLIAGLSDARLARALTALHDDPGAPWTLAALAREAGMSRSAFAATFRAVVGQTPAEYMTDWRLALAQARLRDGEPIKQLATTLGYANASALSRAFTARVGMSPRAWLRQADQPASNRLSDSAIDVGCA